MSKQEPAKPAETDHGQSVIERTIELINTHGLGWSKAMEQARQERQAAEGDGDEIADF